MNYCKVSKEKFLNSLETLEFASQMYRLILISQTDGTFLGLPSTECHFRLLNYRNDHIEDVSFFVSKKNVGKTIEEYMRLLHPTKKYKIEWLASGEN
jgi:hypothetical protein